MAAYEAVTEKDKDILNSNSREKVQLANMFNKQQAAFLEMLKVLESMRNGHRGHFDMERALLQIVNDDKGNGLYSSIPEMVRCNEVPPA